MTERDEEAGPEPQGDERGKGEDRDRLGAPRGRARGPGSRGASGRGRSRSGRAAPTPTVKPTRISPSVVTRCGAERAVDDGLDEALGHDERAGQDERWVVADHDDGLPGDDEDDERGERRQDALADEAPPAAAHVASSSSRSGCRPGLAAGDGVGVVGGPAEEGPDLGRGPGDDGGVEVGQAARPGQVDRDVGDDDSRSGRQDDDPVGEEDGLGDAVGDEDDRRPDPLPEAEQLDVEALAGERVEGAERLVEEEHGRLERERPGDRDPLAHPAGELARPRVGPAVEADEAEEVAGAGVPIRRPGARRPRAGRRRWPATSATAGGAAPGRRGRRAGPVRRRLRLRPRPCRRRPGAGRRSTRRSVLFPQPFGPTSATTDRRATSRSTPASTGTDCPPTAKANRRPARRIAGASSGAADTGSSTTGRGAPSGAGTSAPESTTAPGALGRREAGREAPEETADPVAAPPLRGTRHPCGRLCAPCGTRPALASGSDTLRRRCDRRTASPPLRKGRPS